MNVTTEDASCPVPDGSCHATLAPGAISHGRPQGWRQRLKSRLVDYGIRAIWGKSSFPTSLAGDVPVASAAVRMGWLRVLGACGVREIIARSGLGHDFVCHIGDLAEYPYYHRRAFRSELAICAAWLGTETKPVICDVGANVGFFATQLAQMLRAQLPEIYAFEPVPTTFNKLVRSVERLGLGEHIHVIQAAVVDEARPVKLSYTDKNSLYAQIVTDKPNLRAGNLLAYASGITLDAFCSERAIRPSLLKIDVEGFEAAVLRGTRNLLAQPDRPALLFEYFREAQLECSVAANEFQELLSGYRLHYIDDLEGQRLPFGAEISGVEEVPSGCNLFGVPLGPDSAERWAAALNDAIARQCS